jgi:hypothetical protein
LAPLVCQQSHREFENMYASKHHRSASYRVIARGAILFATHVALLILATRPTEASAAEPSSAATAETDADGFLPLFDGRSFDGWEGDTERTFRIEEGAVVAGSLEKPVPQNEFLCTEKSYADFELRLEAKLTGKGQNAGVQFRSRRIPNHHEVIGYQCDMGTGQGRSIWGSLYDESRRRRFLAEGDADKVKQAVREDGWNELVIRCEGPHVTISVNGLTTVDYTEDQADVAREGIIGLQIHGGDPAEARYRNIRIKVLK